MANTYINILIHTVFSTKNHESWLSSSLRERLYPYMCGIARENGLKVLCIGGTDNHIHILLSLDSTTSIAKAINCLPSIVMPLMGLNDSQLIYLF